MGYETDRFIAPVDDDFICVICNDVMQEPQQTPCEHVFCKPCILEWIQRNTTCPVDRKKFHMNHLKPAARYFRNQILKLVIKCATPGCTTIFPLEELDTHMKKCEENLQKLVPCNVCGLQLVFIKVKTHNCVHALKDIIDNLTKETAASKQLVTMQTQKLDSLTVKYNQMENSKDKTIASLKAQVNQLTSQLMLKGSSNKQSQEQDNNTSQQFVSGDNVSASRGSEKESIVNASKYERTKQIVETHKKNEEILKAGVEDLQVKLKKAENRYELIKQHAEEKINLANQEIDLARRSNESELTKQVKMIMMMMIKKQEIIVASQEQYIIQKDKEIAELSAICDELISKVGT